MRFERISCHPSISEFSHGERVSGVNFSFSEKKGVFGQTGMELHYRAVGLRGREIGELFGVGLQIGEPG